MAFDLKVGEQVSVPPTGYKSLILDVDGNPFLLSDDGTRAAIGGEAGAVSVEAPLTGDGTIGDPLTISDGDIPVEKLEDFAAAGFLGAAAAGAASYRTVAQSLATMLPDMYRSRVGTDVDGTQNTTRHPMQEQIGVMFCRNLTGNRVLTLGATGAATADIIDIIRTDTSGNTLQVNNHNATVLATFPASPTVPLLLRFYFSGGNWTYNVRTFLQAT
jgi:hypothetical protein